MRQIMFLCINVTYVCLFKKIILQLFFLDVTVCRLINALGNLVEMALYFS